MNRSRLPVSTSVRRPTSIAKGSTSFAGTNNRPSAIPSTLRKYANELFTPQTKTPRSTYGASTAGKSYRPTVATEKKYKKPLPEREELQQMFDTLLDYLKTNAPNLPLPEAKRFFSSVSTTESTKIFQLLIGALLPEFKISRLETDVPEALASLEYPYIRSVTKSSLVSVTSRSAAASLLVIFVWLIMQIHTKEKKGVHSDLPSYDNVDQDEIYEVCRIKLLQPEAGKSAFQEALKRLNPSEDIETLISVHEETTREHERLAKESEEMQELIQELKAFDDDIKTSKEYAKELEKFSSFWNGEKEERCRQEEKIRLRKVDVNMKIKRAELDIENHELKLDEVSRDKAVLEQLESQRAKLRKEIDGTSADIKHLRTKANHDFKDEIKTFIVAKSDSIKRLYQDFESQNYLESKILSQRKTELGQWITRLENLQPDDLGQVQRVNHDLSLYKQGLQATEQKLEAEIWEILSRFESELNKLKGQESSYRDNEAPLVEEALERIEREVEDEKIKYMEDDSRWDAQRGDNERKLITMRSMYDVKLGQLDMERERYSEHLEADRKESDQIVESSELEFRAVSETNKQETKILLNQVEEEAKQWEKAKIISERNNQIVKTAHRRLRKKFELAA